ncbi:glycosyltransferase family 4 protein [Paenibacillus silviterrae]|uniref:glycosyltransferase family 4 protein n=1 Tax=Paenibacillus silviterrae TaxID=3242194 RepID=UPI002543E40C|nr:glycosyltransferase family 1 protein [Paenibacillus chinjuensis]
MKKIILFGESANSSSGISRYIRALAKGVQERSPDFEYTVAARNLKSIPNFDKLGVHYRTHPLKGRLQELVRKMPAGDALLFGSSDVVHEPNYQYSQVKRGTRTVLTVHDVGWRIDKTPYGLAPGFIETAELAIRRSSRIITPTETVRQDVIRFFNYPAENIHVIPHGVDPLFLQVGLPERSLPQPLPEAYWLFVGALTARKNMDRAIQALSAMTVKLPLVIAGDATPYARELVQYAEKLGVQVHIISGAGDEDLRVIYSKSTGLLYPSLWEGFGLPIIEAASTGTPIITSGNTAMKEISSGYSQLVEPSSVKEIAAALQWVLQLDETERQELRVRGRELARAYTWERSIDAHIKLYEQMVS